MDPRIARTRQSLEGALLELAAERSLDEVTVADIAERAGVNRSSFYQHYADKDTLLADALDAILEEVGLSVPTPVDQDGTVPPMLVGYLEHMLEHLELYRDAIGTHGSPVVADRLRLRMEALVRHHLAAAGDAAPLADVPPEIVAAGVAGAGLGAVRAWLEQDPPAPVEIAADWIWRLLLGPGGTPRS